MQDQTSLCRGGVFLGSGANLEGVQEVVDTLLIFGEQLIQCSEKGEHVVEMLDAEEAAQKKKCQIACRF